MPRRTSPSRSSGGEVGGEGWSSVTSEAGVKCSMRCFQSNASAPPCSRRECSLTDVARTEGDADGFFFPLFFLTQAPPLSVNG